MCEEYPNSTKAPATRTSSPIILSPSSGSQSHPSSATMSPDVIEETPPPSQRSIRELVRKEIANIQSAMNTPSSSQGRPKSHSRCRRHRHYVSESSTDSEDGEGPKVSFLHAEGQRMAPGRSQTARRLERLLQAFAVNSILSKSQCKGE